MNADQVAAQRDAVAIVTGLLATEEQVGDIDRVLDEICSELARRDSDAIIHAFGAILVCVVEDLAEATNQPVDELWARYARRLATLPEENT